MIRPVKCFCKITVQILTVDPLLTYRSTTLRTQ